MAKAMRAALAARKFEISHSEALEIVARQFGLDSWNILSAKIDAAGEAGGKRAIAFEPAVPIVRIFDIAKAHEFYLGFLGFKVDWEHRFDPDMPLYTQVSRAGLAAASFRACRRCQPGLQHGRLHERASPRSTRN